MIPLSAEVFNPYDGEPTYNSIDADYYADYEGGAFYR